MEDYVVAQFKKVDDKELGLFAIFDGHLSHDIPNYLRSHLFDNILTEVIHDIFIASYFFLFGIAFYELFIVSACG